MPPTVRVHGDGEFGWPEYSLANDLEEQAGVIFVIINVLSTGEYYGKYRGCPIRIIHKGGVDYLLLITEGEPPQELIKGFSKVLGYKPFCRYQTKDEVITEWDGNNPEERLTKIQRNPEVHNLVRL